MDKTPTQWMIEPLRRYAQFSGRARRAEFWWFLLFAFCVALIAAVLDTLLGLKPARGGTGLIGGLCSLGLFIPQLAVQIRRLHDLDRTGWWIGAIFVLAVPAGGVLGVAAGGTPSSLIAVLIALLSLAVLVYSIVLLVWFCKPGTVGPNRFGPDPLALDDGNTVALI